jgi:hypothetical protein
MADRKIWEVGEDYGSPLGHDKISVTASSAVALDVPEGARRVLLRTDEPITWRDDGTDPTTSTGFPLLADEAYIYNATDGLAAFKMIATSATADVRVAFYGD